RIGGRRAKLHFRTNSPIRLVLSVTLKPISGFARAVLLAAGDTTGSAEGMDVRRMAGWLGALVLAGPALADEAPPEIVVTA
ncbi:hypothetical protein, partial [Enterococcus faecalis]|uniref:hypothetical protein n=1 Tax=Enterococcus faecalis TaxID=1351 RepID=UPI00403F191F